VARAAADRRAPKKFGEHIRAELAKWAPVVTAAGLKVD